MNDYDLLKRRFDQSGINLNQSKLLQSFCKKRKYTWINLGKLLRFSFCFLVDSIYEPLKEVSLLKKIALFSQLLIMREFEVIYWAALNQKSDIEDIIKEN